MIYTVCSEHTTLWHSEIQLKKVKLQSSKIESIKAANVRNIVKFQSSSTCVQLKFLGVRVMHVSP